MNLDDKLFDLDGLAESEDNFNRIIAEEQVLAGIEDEPSPAEAAASSPALWAIGLILLGRIARFFIRK